MNQWRSWEVKLQELATDSSSCDKTIAGSGARRGGGQEAQIPGRQRHPDQGCRAWLHHAGDVQDARVLLSRGAGRCLLLRTCHSPRDRLDADPRAFPTLKARRGASNSRQRGPCSPPLQQDRLLDFRWAVIRERSRESQKGSRGGRWQLMRRAAPSTEIGTSRTCSAGTAASGKRQSATAAD